MAELCSITFFGHTHVGKSTLVGYMSAHTDPAFDSRIFVQNEREMGSRYKADRKYAYLVDTHDDERLRTPGTNLHGTSLALHITKITIDNSDINVFDTPGSENRRKEAHKGLYFGDIGIFVIDIADLLNWPEHHYPRLFAHLFTWQKFDRASKDLVIVLAKMDTVSYSEDAFRRACMLLKIASGAAESQVIPTAICVDRSEADNVLVKSSLMPWYEGKCLFNELQDLVKINRYSPTESAFMPVEKIFTATEEGIVLRGKVLEGAIQIGQTVRIMPMNLEGGIGSLQAKIHTIRNASTKDDITVARAGAFVTVLIKDLRFRNRRTHKIGFDAPKTACLFANCVPKFGTLVQIEIDKKENIDLRTFESIKIIWFGRTLGASVVSISHHDKKFSLILQFDGSPVAMHLDNLNQPAIKYFVGLSDRLGAFRCTLTAISESADIILPVKDVAMAEDFFSKIRETFEVVGNSLVFRRERPKEFLQSKLELFKHETAPKLKLANQIEPRLG